jgi:hypothetical protein
MYGALKCMTAVGTTEQRTKKREGISFYLVQAWEWEYYEMSELGSPPPLLPATLGGERMRADYIQGSMSELYTYGIRGRTL